MPSKHRPLLLLAVPLVLSAYTHLWNPAGFPDWHVDEGVYLDRALGVLDHELLYGLYDHPFLGQTVLAGFLHVAGYPGSFVTSADPSSLGMLYGIPRVLMGTLAVLDTFLIYKIAEKRFGRRTALIASILFAVMPVSLTLRMVLLDSILIPFVLASVLLAMHARGAGPKGDPAGPDPGIRVGETSAAAGESARQHSSNAIRSVPGVPNPVLDKTRLLIVMSGVCMGCAILTKIPSLSMIPLVLALIYSANRSPRQTLLWLVPVILIQLVWPASAMLAGELDLWMEGVLWQADRNGQHALNALQKYLPVDLVQGQDPDVLTHPLILLAAIGVLFLRDPVLMTLGAAGLAFAAVTRNRFLMLWAAPVLLFFGSIGYVSYFHLGMLWTAMCVAAAALIGAGIRRMPAGGHARNLTLLAAVAAIATFGMSVSGVLVHWDATSSYLDGLSFALQNYTGSDTVLVMEMLPKSLLLWVSDRVHAGTDTSDTPDLRPTETKKTVMVTSSHEIDRYRRMLEASYPGPDGVTVPHGAGWVQRYVELYDGSDKVAKFQCPSRQDMPAPTYLLYGRVPCHAAEIGSCLETYQFLDILLYGHVPCPAAEIMERLPP